jgi:hypothetical protein
LQHALEKMKEAVRNGGKYPRDRFEELLPFVTLGVVTVAIVLYLIFRPFA